MSHQLLEEENLALKKQVNLLQQQLNDHKNQLDQQNEELFMKQQTLRTSRKMSCIRKEIINEKSKQMKKTVDLVENNMNQFDKKSMVLAQTMDAGHNKSGSDPLEMRLSAKRKHNAIFKKYEMMLKIGVDLDGVLVQMNKDKIGNSLINKFKDLHNDDINQNDWKIDITTEKYSKYNRMKKLRMPMKTILNKMKLDGISQLEMDIFCGKVFASSSSSSYNKRERDPTKIAEQLGLPPKLDIPKPTEKMKKIRWKPVKLEMVKQSMWNKVNHQWFDYEPKKFELRFQARLNKPKLNKKILRKSSVLDEIKNDNQRVQFVDSKRSQQIEAVLISFNMTNDELRNVILTMDETKMDVDKIRSLISIVPTPSEQSTAEIQSIDKNIQYFGISERFIYSLHDVVELERRLKKWCFKMEFQDKINELTEKIIIIEKAKLTITLSKELREIFSILLAFGNHMNYNDKHNCNAYGFLLSDLSLLPQIKTFDHTMTFPTYLYSFLQKKYPDLLHVIEQFQGVHEAATICGDIIDKEYNALIRETKDLDAMITRFHEEYHHLLSDDDMFIAKMTDFQKIIKQSMWKLTFKFESFHKSERQLIKYFGYQLDEEVNIQKIFMDISAFIHMLEDGEVELKQFEEMKKKRAAKRQRLLRKKKKTVLKRANTAHLTRNRMKKYATTKKKQYAISLEDVGTPVAEQSVGKQTSYDSIMYLFDESVENQPPTKPLPKLISSASNGPSPLPQKTNIISFGRFSGDKAIIHPYDENSKKNKAVIHPYDSCLNDKKEDDVNIADIAHLKLKLDTKYNTMQPTPNKRNNNNNGNSLASRIKMFESKSSPNNNNNNKKAVIHKKKNSVCLISSNSRLTPYDDKSHANVEELFGAIETLTNNNKKSRHKRKDKMHKSLPLKSKDLNNYSTKSRKRTRTFSNKFIQSIYKTDQQK